jgi:hypothetical protein
VARCWGHDHEGAALPETREAAMVRIKRRALNRQNTE